MIDFGLPNGSRYLKIDARAGCFRVKDDGQDISFTALTAAMDVLHVKVGWFAFTKNGVSVVEGVKTPQPPAIDGIEYKQGLAVRLISSDKPTGCTEALGEREITTTSIVVRRAFAELYQQAVAQASKDYGTVAGEIRSGAPAIASANTVPIVRCDGFRQVKAAKGIAYAPVMHITGWQAPTAADTDFAEF